MEPKSTLHRNAFGVETEGITKKACTKNSYPKFTKKHQHLHLRLIEGSAESMRGCRHA
jgi:hypothetical protein